jgi:hypothetical protein
LGIEDKTEFSVNAAIAQDLRIYARRRWPLANDKFRKDRLAHLLNVSARRIKSLWEAEDTAVIRQQEAEAVRRLIGQQKIEEANRETFQALQARIARLEAALFAQDEEFHQPQMAALRGAVGSGRGGNVASPVGQDGRLETGEAE